MKRNLIEWLVMALIMGGIYLMGWHTQLIGTVQGWLLLRTGIVKPSIAPDPAQWPQGSYQLALRRLDSGQPLTLDSLRGRVVFLNFWATWCPPCVAEMPEIHELYEQYGNQVAFVMVAVNDKPDKVRRFLEQKDYRFAAYEAQGPLPAEYASRAIPTTFILSKNGRIALRREGLASYNNPEVRALLDTLLARGE